MLELTNQYYSPIDVHSAIKDAPADGVKKIADIWTKTPPFNEQPAPILETWSGVNIMSPMLRGIPQGGILLVTLIETFHLFSSWE